MKRKKVIRTITKQPIEVKPTAVHNALVRGALGYIRNRKTEEKNHPKPQKNSAKTENRIQNRQKPIQW